MKENTKKMIVSTLKHYPERAPRIDSPYKAYKCIQVDLEVFANVINKNSKRLLNYAKKADKRLNLHRNVGIIAGGFMLYKIYKLETKVEQLEKERD